MFCSRCKLPAGAAKFSEELGTVIYQCGHCRLVTIDRGSHWIPLDLPDLAAGLRQLIDIRDEADRRHKEFMEADFDDPRWGGSTF